MPSDRGNPDTEIPFRLSDSNAIATNTARTNLLIWINGGELTVLCLLLTFLLMRG
jgi:hypothetical protein